MPITTTTTHTTSSAMSVHTISFRGLAGGIFITLVVSAVLYVIGFATTAWSIQNNIHQGLWETCNVGYGLPRHDAFKATQAMITIGLIGLIVAFILICLYMSVHSISKNTTLIALVIVCFVSVFFMVVGFIVFGTWTDGLNWSFALAVIGCLLCLVAGILSVVQMRQSGVRM